VFLTSAARMSDDKAQILKVPRSDDVPMAAVAPVQAVITEVPAVIVMGQPQPQAPVPHAPQWKSDVLDCFADGRTCCVVFWLGCIPVAQLWERIKGPKGACLSITIIFALLTGLYVYTIALDMLVFQSRAACRASISADERLDCERHGAGKSIEARTEPYENFGQFLSICISVLALILLTKLRSHIRQRDRIAETQCNGCEDFCCALWCSSCLTCQLLRHEGLKGAEYKLCDAKGGDPATPPTVVQAV